MRIAISGVSRGIGEGIARAALARGDDVLGFGRTEPPWASERFTFVNCDMADHDGVTAACTTVADPIDVLVCGAATFANHAWTAETVAPDALAEAFSVNTIAPLVMARALKRNLEAGQRRLVVMMSTGNASLEGNSAGTMLGYRLSKTALNQAVRNLAAEWAADRFTVVALNPGWVRTDMGGSDAPLSVDEASAQILEFVDRTSNEVEVNGRFVNWDGSQLPW